MLYMIWGYQLGCGKTGYMVLQGHNASVAGRTVYSNFWTSFSKEVQVAEALLLRRDLGACVLLIDELWSLLDSRDSLGGNNEFVNDVVLMSRKRGMDILGTAPMAGMVDLRFRNIADLSVLCERRGKEYDIRAWIKASEYAVDLRKVGGLAVHVRRFKVSQIADLYHTHEVIERDRVTYVEQVSRAILTNQHVIEKLQEYKNDTMRKSALRAFCNIRSNYSEIILEELKGLGVWNA